MAHWERDFYLTSYEGFQAGDFQITENSSNTGRCSPRSHFSRLRSSPTVEPEATPASDRVLFRCNGRPLVALAQVDSWSSALVLNCSVPDGVARQWASDLQLSQLQLVVADALTFTAARRRFLSGRSSLRRRRLQYLHPIRPGAPLGPS